MDSTIKTLTEDRVGVDSRMEIGLLPPLPLGRVGWTETIGWKEGFNNKNPSTEDRKELDRYNRFGLLPLSSITKDRKEMDRYNRVCGH